MGGLNLSAVNLKAFPGLGLQLGLGFVWSYLMTFYGIQVCPYISSLEAITAFLIFASGIFALLILQPEFQRQLSQSKQPYRRKLLLLFSSWVFVGLVISLFNNIVLSFPIGSGIKVIFGFIGLGLYSSLSQNLDLQYFALLNNKAEELKPTHFHSITSQMMACFTVALIFAGVALVLLLQNDLTMHASEYMGEPRKILYSVMLHAIFIIAVTVTAATLLTRKLRRNMALIVERQLDQMDQVLQGSPEASIPVLSNDEFGQFAQRTNLLIADLHDQKLEIKTLQTENYTDPLTGIYNRKYLYNYIYEEMSLTPVLLLIIDIDHFKSINDKHGHDMGDRVLIGLTQNIQKSLASTAKFCRIGGEEFVLLHPLSQQITIQQQADNICSLVNQTPISANNIQLKISCSIGYTVFKPEQETFESTLKRADKALYKAKNGGRNQACAAE